MSTERIATVARDLIDAINATLDKHEVGYDEFQAAKAWLIEVGEAGEWPLYLDVFHEHIVENLAARNRRGSDSTIEGPYYLPDSPQLHTPAALPQRDDEPGDVLVFRGRIADCDGSGLPNAVLDMWQSDADGFYSGFDSDAPVPNLRAQITADAEGRFEVRTVVPAPYEIPKGGPTGKLLREAGWHAWRPAHLHFMVRADGYEPLTTQLYIEGDRWMDSDVASAVKPGLVLPLADAGAGEHGVDVAHKVAGYEFRLDPARVPAAA